MNQDHFVKKIVCFSFGNQVLIFMFIAVVSMLGVMSYAKMSRNVYPEITIPVFTIITENEVMAPEEIEMSITIPMEAAMNGLPGVKRIRSQTTQGLSSVVVEFDITSEFWRARQFVSERISQIAPTLPAGTEPPNLSSATTRLAEVCEISFQGDISDVALRELADWQARYKLLTVPGVAEVLNMGGKMRQFRVAVNMDALLAKSITVADIEKALKEGNENAAGGFISTGVAEYNVRALGRFTNIEDIRNVVVATNNSIPVYLKDVADVTDSYAITRGIVSRNGKSAVAAIIIKQPDADTVDVVKGVKKALAELRETLPKGVELYLHYDQTKLIDSSLKSVLEAIVVGAVLVVVVLAVFMGNMRSTFVVAISIPLSVLLAGNAMRILGVGINTMSLGGLAIAVGIMVDASIIVVENIFHRYHQRKKEGVSFDRSGLAMKSASEVALPVAGATAVIVSVFLPLFMMEGIEGLLFRPLALTVVASMLSALLLSLCFTPVVAAKVLDSSSSKQESDDVKLVMAIKKIYSPVLEFTLKRPKLVIFSAMTVMILSVISLAFLGRDFMPKMDEGAWVISTATAPETSLEENNRITSQIEKLLLENENIEEVIRRNGRSERAIGCVLPVNSGEIIVNLKPRNKRRKPAQKLLAEVRRQIEAIPGVAIAFTQPFQLKIDESLEGTPAPLQVKIFGNDPKTLQAKGIELRDIMENVKGLEDVNLTQSAGIPQLQINIDRFAAARYGIPVSSISELVRFAVGGEEVTQLWNQQRSYGVFVRAQDGDRNDPQAIGRLIVDGGEGRKVPLSQLASVELSQGPNVIWREAMNRMININASISNSSLSKVVSEVKEGMANVSLPAGYFVVFAGQFENQQRAMKSLLFAAFLSLILVFTIIYMVMRSFSESLLILVTAPSALIGGILFLFLFGETLNVSSGVGFIALFGIAVQNSLVLLSQTKDFIAEGHTPAESIILASVQRLRPKLMTVLCTALGLLPILLSNASGAEIEKPLAITLIGGLLTSTIFTLLVLPSAYTVLDGYRARMPKKQQPSAC